MTRVDMVRDGETFRLTLKPQQRDLLESVLLFMAGRDEPESIMMVWTGASGQSLADLRSRAVGGRSFTLSLGELHVVHATLLAIKSLFVSEEDFHVKIGFFRENIDELARNLIGALDRAEAT